LFPHSNSHKPEWILAEAKPLISNLGTQTIFGFLAMLKNCSRTKATFWGFLFTRFPQMWAFKGSVGFDFSTVEERLHIPSDVSVVTWLLINWDKWVPDILDHGAQHRNPDIAMEWERMRSVMESSLKGALFFWIVGEI